MHRKFVSLMALCFLSCAPFAAVNAIPGDEIQDPKSESLVVINKLVSRRSLMMMMGTRSKGQETTAGNESYSGAAANMAVMISGEETFPVPLPIANTMPTLERENGAQELTTLEYGTGGIPYTTKGSYGSNAPDSTAKFPWVPTGKLVWDGGPSCTASMIGRGLAVTAAHCVSEYGKKSFLNPGSSLYLEPGRFDDLLPFGRFPVVSITVPRTYFDGSDPCDPNSPGVICENDIAVLLVGPTAGVDRLPGEILGYYGYGSGYSFVDVGDLRGAQIAQLGYPSNLDNGVRMIRTDSLGLKTSYNNVIIGSLQGGGSSGGPWLVNFGQQTTLSGGTVFGSSPDPNVVIGTTSWGYTDFDVKVQGASRFGTNSIFKDVSNIQVLINQICKGLNDDNLIQRFCGSRYKP
eukprot:jgi/Picsp_1/4449/NSC_06671-R1_peptidase s1 and s6 chymotrypsin hap